MTTFKQRTEIFHKHFDEHTKKVQKLVNDLKQRMVKLESVEFTEVSFKQHKFLKEIIEVLAISTNSAAEYIELLGTEHNWTIDKEMELQKEKLLNIKLIKDLDTARSQNVLLARLQTKLGGAKIIKRPLYILHPKFVNNFPAAYIFLYIILLVL